VNDSRVAELAEWGRALAEQGGSAELRAAGRAIQMLAAEVERLQERSGGSDPDPPGGPAGAGAPAPPRRRRRERDPRHAAVVTNRLPPWSRRAQTVLLIVAAVGLLAAGTVAAARRAFAPEIHLSGPAEGAALGPAAADRPAFAVDADGATLQQQRWKLDESDVTSQVRIAGRRLVLVPRRLADGDHKLVIEQRGGLLGAHARRTLHFAVDRSPPRIELTRPLRTRRSGPLAVRGRAAGASEVAVAGRQVEQTSNHRFSLDLTPPLPRAVVIVARDRAGNTEQVRFRVDVVPRRPPVPVRAVHVTFYGWGDRTLRHGVVQLIDEHRINAVELDLKDESGIVGFKAPISLALRIGAERQLVDLRRTVDQLHRRGIRVIGRLVCFRDPLLASAAWRRGRRSQVVQTPQGLPYAGYGGFTNFANAGVRRYNIDIARAAAAAGVDEVLYDYVRRPDGPRSSMVFPGLHSSPEEAIVSFLAATRRALQPYGTFLGASVFGVAADRPREVAQPIPEMAQQVDYIAPMVYPSHWTRGEYDVADPNAEPYAIVRRSLEAFQRDVRGTGARIVPWLQDFSLGVNYGAHEVRQQIDAAHADGIDEFLLWDPAVTYTRDALVPGAPTAAEIR
jgi:hypothetical protein